ncbi:MAG: peptidoglycan DD-metalloendopeptidase family protein [Balneolaceae bacterium]
MKPEKTAVRPVMNIPESPEIFDFTKEYDPGAINRLIKRGGWGIGRYNEKRRGMYVAPQYQNRRYIHMGIDIWAPAGEPVYAVLDGEVVYTGNHPQEGNYGAAIVLKHQWKNKALFALYGHLSTSSLEKLNTGDEIRAGEQAAVLGDETENGNWPPHLHYQISRVDPGEADMPGVVSEDELEEALKIYPDPRMIIGPVY